MIREKTRRRQHKERKSKNQSQKPSGNPWGGKTQIYKFSHCDGPRHIQTGSHILVDWAGPSCGEDGALEDNPRHNHGKNRVQEVNQKTILGKAGVLEGTPSCCIPREAPSFWGWLQDTRCL